MPAVRVSLTQFSPDIIVCVDACFTQKRRKGITGGRDPPREHPETVFIPEGDVKAVEAEVNRLRGSVPHASASPLQDSTEPNLRVPNSVLDGCNDSFKAADERRQKASTEFFADTGLMAMLCRHDRVLWLVNMTSAGEKQHYAVSLVRRLFEHLPPHVTVGLLYDIACQLHRSIEKWGLLGPLARRLHFGISVFHAFGHQWPCQVVYHPRKCTGFGLSDGEGCERFWSSIQRLIPSLRVSGVSVCYQSRWFLTLYPSIINASLSLILKSSTMTGSHFNDSVSGSGASGLTARAVFPLHKRRSVTQGSHLKNSELSGSCK